MDVPEIVLVAVFDVFQSEVMFTPGARRSTMLPKLEKLAKKSLMSVATIAIASATSAGDCVEASADEFPAETQYTTPSAMEFLTALSRAVETGPPSDMFATAGLVV